MAKITNTKNEHTYFHSLELEGVGCFKEKQSLDLSNGANNYAPWTLILGDNGTGKTTLLRTLERQKPLNMKVFENDDLILPMDFAFQDFNVNKNRSTRIKVLNINGHKIINNSMGAWGKYPEEFSNLFVLSYGASRKMSKANNLFSIKETIFTTLFDDSLELINAEEWYFQKYLNLQTADNNFKRVFEKQLEIIKQLLIDFLPDVSDLKPKVISDIKSTSSLEVKLESGEWIPLRDLSYGYQTMTALLVDIGSRMMDKYPESDNPLAEPVIILIDEIDLHLHPKWQRQIMEQFSKYFPKAQFIVTSHSPLIVQAAEAINANIVVCRKDGDKVIIDNNPEEVKGWRIDQILISDLFDLPTVRSNADEEKMSRYYELEAKSERTIQEESELEDIQKDIKKSFESDKPFSETERKINQFLETHLK